MSSKPTNIQALADTLLGMVGSVEDKMSGEVYFESSGGETFRFVGAKGMGGYTVILIKSTPQPWAGVPSESKDAGEGG